METDLNKQRGIRISVALQSFFDQRWLQTLDYISLPTVQNHSYSSLNSISPVTLFSTTQTLTTLTSIVSTGTSLVVVGDTLHNLLDKVLIPRLRRMSRNDTIKNHLALQESLNEKPRATEFQSTGIREPTLLHTPTLISDQVPINSRGALGLGSLFTRTNRNDSPRHDWEIVEAEDQSRQSTSRSTLQSNTSYGNNEASTSEFNSQSRKNFKPTNLILPPFLRTNRSTNTNSSPSKQASTSTSTSPTSPTSTSTSPSKLLPPTPRDRVNTNYSPPSSISPRSNPNWATPRSRSTSSEIPRSTSYNSSTSNGTNVPTSLSNSNLASSPTNSNSKRPTEERSDSNGSNGSSNSNSTSSSSNNSGNTSSGRISSSNGSTTTASNSGSSNNNSGFFRRDSRSPRESPDRMVSPKRLGMVSTNRTEEVIRPEESEVDAGESGRSMDKFNAKLNAALERTTASRVPLFPNPANSQSSLGRPILLSDSYHRTELPILPTTPSSLQTRRASTLNIDNLHLLGFGSPNPTTVLLPSLISSPPSITSELLSEEFASSSSSASSIIHSSNTLPTSAAVRLRTLPRLLSNDGYNFTSNGRRESNVSNRASLDSEESSETEGETETEEEETETEGETDTDAESSDDSPTPIPIPLPSPSLPLKHSVSHQEVHSPSFNSSPIRFAARNARPGSLRTNSYGNNGQNWVTFDPSTPTPLRTARPINEGASSSQQSYFDLPTRPMSTISRTPGVTPLMTPLIRMSPSSVARGKRPVREDESIDLSTIVPADENNKYQHDNLEPVEMERAGSFYRRRSHSALDLLSPHLLGEDKEELGTAALGELDPVWQTDGLITPGPAFLSPTISNSSKFNPNSPTLNRISSFTPKLNRPRSMYELHVAPPAYHAVYSRSGFATKVFPREEEGKEYLPDYSCAVHLEGYLPRKMEFSGPNIQSKDRGWKKQWFVLHGTSIKIFKYDLRTHPMDGISSFDYTDDDLHPTDGPELLHVHPYLDPNAPFNPIPNNTPSFSKPRPLSIVKAKAHLPSSHPSANVLLRHYSLQNAESGLAADYVKRKHVVRVRAEGEQFLLQAQDDRGVIDLIEALQAATNIALDLDARPLPKFITLPRRRRRRRIVNGLPTINPGQSAVLESNQIDESRLSDMLEEEQSAYSGARDSSDL